MRVERRQLNVRIVMWSDSFDVYETVIFPIVGGVIAGFIVVIVELVFRYLYDRWQQSKAINAVKKLFGEWESKITNAEVDPIGWTGLSHN